MCKRNGFTLIELLITMSILVIVLSLAVPGAKQLVRNNQLTASTNDLMGTMHYARSEAIRRGVPVGICSSTDQANCNGGTDWSTGWIVWVDIDNDNVLDGGEEVTYVIGYETTSLNVQNLSGQPALRYLPSGYAAIAAGTTMDFRVCDDRTAETGRDIIVNATGSPHVRNATCG